MSRTWFNWTTGQRATGSTGSTPTTQAPSAPKIAYTPDGVAKQPGFNNPSNPYDTGRPGEKNSEKVAYGQGGKVDWWDYDRGAPKSGVQLNAEGFYYGQGGGAGMRSPSGFVGDPVLAQAQALAARQREIARAAALAKRKQAAIEFGDPSGVTGLDEATMAAARDNPFSVLANMKRGYESGVQNLEEDLNQSNLFYSGYRGNKLGEAATEYQGQRAGATSAFQSLLTDIEGSLAQALLNADWQEAAALESAYMRALNQALEYGYGYPDSGSDGDGAQTSLVDAYRSMGAGPRAGPPSFGRPTNPPPKTGGRPGWKYPPGRGGGPKGKPPPRRGPGWSRPPGGGGGR